jgi:hypothetical protein
LDSTQSEIFHQIESGYKDGKDIQSILSGITPEQFSHIKPIAKESYQMIRNIFDHADPGLQHLRGLMVPCANIYRNEIQWVKIEHLDAWKYAKLPLEERTTPHCHEIHTSVPPNQMKPSVEGSLNHAHEDCHRDPLEIIPYDPWVLVHPPHVSSMDCEDVERISRWIQSEVHLLHSSSESIATKLVMDNCPHIERLKIRLTREPHYLLSLGVSEEDSNDIKNAIFESQSSSDRGWCSIS